MRRNWPFKCFRILEGDTADAMTAAAVLLVHCEQPCCSFAAFVLLCLQKHNIDCRCMKSTSPPSACGNVILLDCSASLGSFQHELLHALGVSHEHQRPNRDKLIELHGHHLSSWCNAVQFTKLEKKRYTFAPGANPADETYWVPFPWPLYCLASIMHYRRGASLTVRDTRLTVLPPGVDVGQRLAMTAHDVVKLKTLYLGERPRCRGKDKCKCCPACRGHGCICQSLRLEACTCVAAAAREPESS
jgi:hypothetical protein